MNEERIKSKNLMIYLNELLTASKFKEVNKIISDLDPKEDSLRIFTSVIHCSFIYRIQLKDWSNKVEEFYLFHRNTENVEKWFIGLRGDINERK